MTIHFTLHPVTLYLLYATVALGVLGPVLMLVTARWLEIGAFIFLDICWALAVVALLVAIGTAL